jgi:peroxiredoxin
MTCTFFHVNAQSDNLTPSQATDISPLLIGEKAPDLKVVNLKGDSISLLNSLSSKPTVLIFYRGGWCPYCNVHLADLQEIEDQIIAMGYQIVAISPDDSEHLNTTVDKNKLKYLLYSDANLQVAKGFGIAFQAADRSKEKLHTYSGGINPGFLPVPSVFVLDKKGEILFEYINPNYKIRLKGSLLLAVLSELNK